MFISASPDNADGWERALADCYTLRASIGNYYSVRCSPARNKFTKLLITLSSAYIYIYIYMYSYIYREPLMYASDPLRTCSEFYSGKFVIIINIIVEQAQRTNPDRDGNLLR